MILACSLSALPGVVNSNGQRTDAGGGGGRVVDPVSRTLMAMASRGSVMARALRVVAYHARTTAPPASAPNSRYCCSAPAARAYSRLLSGSGTRGLAAAAADADKTWFGALRQRVRSSLSDKYSRPASAPGDGDGPGFSEAAVSCALEQTLREVTLRPVLPAGQHYCPVCCHNGLSDEQACGCAIALQVHTDDCETRWLKMAALAGNQAAIGELFPDGVPPEATTTDAKDASAGACSSQHAAKPEMEAFAHSTAGTGGQEETTRPTAVASDAAWAAQVSPEVLREVLQEVSTPPRRPGYTQRSVFCNHA